MYDLIIIGGGVSALSASIYASSRNLKTLVIEKNKIGGLVNEISIVSHYLGVENNENGLDFVNRIYKQAKSYNTEFKNEEVLSVDFKEKVVKTNKSLYKSKAIIISTGTDKKEFFIENIEKYIEKNIFYSVEDVEKIKNKVAVVLGSGDGAFKEAIFLSNYAKKVYIITKDKEPKVIFEFIKKISNIENIELVTNATIKELNGLKKLNSILVCDNETKDVFEIKDNEVFLFIFIGRVANSYFLKNIELEDGFIKTKEDLSTNIDGIFASGDIRKKLVRQISTAVSDGTVAAISAFNYIKNI